jgi:hypothetical protein
MTKLYSPHDDCVANLLHLRIIALAPVRTSDTKYIGNYCFIVLSFFVTSFSTTRDPLTAECVAEI